jgi:hypothetical protein
MTKRCMHSFLHTQDGVRVCQLCGLSLLSDRPSPPLAPPPTTDQRIASALERIADALEKGR